MQNEKTRLYPLQMLDAINKIEVSALGLDRSSYENHEVKWVVERGIEIIGKALNRIRNADPSVLISKCQKIMPQGTKLHMSITLWMPTSYILL